MQDNILTHKAIRTGNLASLALDPTPEQPDNAPCHDRFSTPSGNDHSKPNSYEVLLCRELIKSNIHMYH